MDKQQRIDRMLAQAEQINKIISELTVKVFIERMKKYGAKHNG